MHLTNRFESLRTMLYLYLAVVFCPIQYWPLAGDVDNTWIFALNYAHARHLVIGRDIFWNWGPLSYLALPMDIGSNLALGLAFQTAIWLVTLGALWELFYRSGLRLKQLAFFSIFLGLSASVSAGADQVVFRSAMIALLLYKTRHGVSRYVAALVGLGLLPLIKFTWAMAVGGAAAGLAAYSVWSRQSGWRRDALLAVALPLCVAGAGYWLTLGSWDAIVTCLKANSELSAGYSAAMSAAGPFTELLAALEALLLLIVALAAVATGSRDTAIFMGSAFVVPLFVNFKHGFVIQDAHIHHYFCFVAMALSLCTLTAPMNSDRIAMRFAIILLMFTLIWQDNVARTGPDFALNSIGIKTALNVRNLIRHVYFRRSFAEDPPALLQDQGVEDEITSIVGKTPIASLSTTYDFLFARGMELALYPIVQRYSAYTPYLDRLNAAWIRDHGTPFLIFDGRPLGRHPWMDTPAMWLEIYRWYDTRLLTPHNLLLERRTQPRFNRLERVREEQIRFGDELTFSSQSQPTFWSMNCALSGTGKLRSLLFRVPEILMTIEKRDGNTGTFRIPLAVAESPSPGQFLPTTLPEFAAVFRSGAENIGVDKLAFGGPGSSAYNPACSVEFFVASD